MFLKETFIGRVVYGGGFLFDFAKWIILLIIAISLIHFFVATIFFVDGASMDPTFATGELGFLNKIVYKMSDPQRGDVVVVNYPGDPEHKRYVKRVIALPGEKLEIKNGSIFINNRKLIEGYLPRGLQTEQGGDWTLKSDEYFLMGDNRPNSNDSRYFGPVEQRFIVGKTSWILIPKLYSVPTPTYNIK
ncbi:MAG: signal peptidase I [Patescibacteria group bacterium]|jgi:signal peptidase I